MSNRHKCRLLLANLRPDSIRVLSIIGSVIICFAIGCEDVIQVDLRDVEPRIVIEGVVRDRMEPIRVMISKTGNYSDPSVFPKVSGAVVEISIDSGWSEILQEIEPGLYEGSLRYNRPRYTYTMKAEVEGTIYTAFSTMPYPNGRHSITLRYHEGGGYELENGYYLSGEFIDWDNIDDYYRITVRQNGIMLDDYLLFDGALFDNTKFTYEWDGFELGDSLIIEFQALNEQTYDYFQTLSSIVAGTEVTEPNWSPANPVTNLNNDALGYFAAYSVLVDTIIIR